MKDKKTHDVFLKFCGVLKEFSLVKKGDGILIGVSGGPDSTALCFLFKEIQEKLSLRVTLAYLNHGLRKKECLREENFVKSLGKQLGFPVVMERVDAKKAREKSRLSLQEAARGLRYDFYARAAEKCGAKKIALAHHADDQVETLLLRMVEGTGMEGLSGIHPERKMNGLTVIRPLLFAAKKEILDYLKENKIPYCVDSSNEKLVYKRNVVRKKLLPALEKINPGARENLFRLWDIFYHENEHMKGLAREAEKKIVRYAHDSAAVSLKLFARLALPLKRRVLKNALARARGSSEDVTFRHVESARQWMDGYGSEKLILPGGIRAEKNHNRLILTKKKAGLYPQNSSKTGARDEIKIKIPGTRTLWDGFTVHAEILKNNAAVRKALKTKDNESYLDMTKTGAALYARRRKPGDRFIPFGMKSEKKLKDFYIEKKVRHELRDELPVFENAKHIVWVAAGRVDERAKVDKDTQNVLHLILEKMDNEEKRTAGSV